jgi:hypothetical protein
MPRAARAVAALLVAVAACTDRPDGDPGARPSPRASVRDGVAVIEPVADAFVRSDDDNASFGTSMALRVRDGGGEEKEAYVRFDVGALGAGRVAGATLKLFAEGDVGDACADPGAGTDVYELGDDSWGEDVTWAERPSSRGDLLDSRDAFAGGAYVSFDVTEAVPRRGLVSFRVVAPDCEELASDTDFGARESADPPLLEIATRTRPQGRCDGRRVPAGADLHDYVDGATDATFCLAAGSYDIGSEPLTPGDHVTIVGRPGTPGEAVAPALAFEDATLPARSFGAGAPGWSRGSLPTRIYTTEAPQLIDYDTATGGRLSHLELQGARALGDDQTSGRVVSRGRDLVIESVWVHGGANQGIGGFEGGEFDRIEVSGNGSSGFGGVTSGGIKTGSALGYTITNSFVHGNFGPGIWCDHDCDNFRVLDNVAVRNSGAGIRYEHGANVPVCPTCDATIARNTVKENGLWPTDLDRSNAGIVVNSSENATIARNVLGGNFMAEGSETGPNGIYLQHGRHPLRNVIIRDNELNGDAIKTCNTPGVTCAGNG